MSAPACPFDEAERLLRLYKTALLDTPAEERFDRITRLAAQYFNVPVCLFSLVDNDRQWFKSKVGLTVCETDRDISFCGHAILEKDLFIVNDATQDPRFSDNPLVVNEPHIRFYAGAPINEPSGQPIGTLCLIDYAPRSFNAEDQHSLRSFAELLEHEVQYLDHTESQQQLSTSMARMSSILGTLPDIVLVIGRNSRFLVCNEHPDLLKPRHEILGKKISEVLPDELANELQHNVTKAFATDDVLYHEYSLFEPPKTFEARYKKINENEVLIIIRNTTEQTKTNAEFSRLSEVAKQTTNGVVITDKQGVVVWVNEAFSALTGYQLAEIVGQKPGALLQGPSSDPNVIATMREALAKQHSFTVDIVNYSKSKQPYWVHISCNPLWDDNGELKGYIAIETDITQAKLDAEKIRQSENMLKAVVDANSIGTWRWNLITDELFVNKHWLSLLGYSATDAESVTPKTWQELTHPADLSRCFSLLEQHLIGKLRMYEAKIRMKHQDGHWVWINTRGPITSYTPDGKPEWMLGTHFDINEQVKAENSLDEKSKQMEAIVEHMLDGVISIDQTGTINTFNKSAEHIFGYNALEIVGKPISHLFLADAQESELLPLSSNLDTTIHKQNGSIRELTALNKQGEEFPIELGMVEITVADQTNFICIVRDITERKKREHEIHQLAFYDPLTRLPNRRLLLDRLHSTLTHRARDGKFAAVLFLDLDNFKNLNDSAGHNVGDMLLCRVAKRLVNIVRQGDSVSRLGGDEFVIIVDELSKDKNMAATQAEALAQDIIRNLAQVFDLDGTVYNCSASVGVTLFNNQATTKEDLLKQADMAMYKAKEAGRNSVQFFDPQMQIAVNARAVLVNDLYNALQQEQFQLFYQKQIDQHNKVIGAEVLLRWVHPEKGVISPADFIPLAEETGLIVPIGKWVLEQACRTLAKWSTQAATADLIIAVNISVVQFSKADIVNTVLDALNSYNANPQRLKLEITESLLASNVPDVKAKMLALQQHGIAFSIDDFGTGYSSLSYLKQLPLNQLKIDQSFVRDIIENQNDQVIAQTIISLANSLNLEVIAEGVETEAQRALLARIGCFTYQGYLFGKPCALADLVL